MATEIPRALVEISYYHAAQEYLRNLPLEHFMEATSQSTQRKITVESLDLVHARRPDIQVFSELLVQYPRKGERRPGQVVPDNMVVVWKEPIIADGSYDVPLQPAKPFWVLEYVSKSNERKDYEHNFLHYEKALKIPYYLIFYPDTQDITLYHHNGRRYVSVVPEENERHNIPELDLQVGLLDGWVRFWFRGELLPLPADMLKELDRLTAGISKERQRADRAESRADEEKSRADESSRRADRLEDTLHQERENRTAMEKELAELRARFAGGEHDLNS